MKISKKRAIELAIWEEETRNDGQEYEDGWDAKQQVIQEEAWKYWQENPGSMIATMFYDSVIHLNTNAEYKALQKFLGKRLFDVAVKHYLMRDHDT